MSRWAIILAGGEGTRIRPFIEQCLGFYYPKQYCAFCGSRSMLEHTIERAGRLVKERHILTVVGRGHCRYFNEARLPGRVIEQPAARGTAAGIMLPAAHIMAEDPEATVMVFPSDHFIFPVDGIVEHLELALAAAQAWNDRLVLMGAVPEGAEKDYGWIEPGSKLSLGSSSRQAGLKRVLSFHEKPSRGKAANFLAEGYLWNTMIMAAKIKTLWRLARKRVPNIHGKFEILLDALKSAPSGGPTGKIKKRILSELYNQIPTVDFCESLVAPEPGESIVLPLKGVLWSDWGRPERVLETLRQIGKPFTLYQFEPRISNG